MRKGVAYVFKDPHPPPRWAEFRKRARSKYTLPFYYLNWLADCAVYILGKWSLVELLEYLGSFSILFAAIFYFADAPNRLKQKHYQAWQVINTAQGKGGNGGRIDALQELNEDHVALVGIIVSNAYLQGVRLEGAQARRGDFSFGDLREAVFRKSDLEDSIFHFANLRNANLSGCRLAGSDFTDADLAGATLVGADLAEASLARADLSGANLMGAKLDRVNNWKEIQAIKGANLSGARNPPAGFLEWAEKMGALK